MPKDGMGAQPKAAAEHSFYQVIVNSSDLAIVSADTAGLVRSWNPAAERLFDVPAADAIGKSLAAFGVPDRAGCHEANILRPNADPLSARAIVSELRDDTGETTGVSAILQPLDPAEADYRSTVELAPEVWWTATSDGRLETFSPQWLKLTGLTREQAATTGWDDAPHPDDLPRMLGAWSKAIAEGEEFDLEHRIRVADGSYRWMRTRARPRKDQSGHILRWHGYTEDIHDRKTSEMELQRARRDLADILESIAESFIAVDREWRFVYANERVARGLGIHRDDLIGRNLWEVCPPMVREVFYEKYRRVMEERIPLRFETNYTGDRWFEVHAHPTETGMSAYIVEKTEQKRTEDALRQKAKLESIGLVAGGVAHDFNNLLVGILGAASLAEEMIPEDRPEQEMVRLIADSAERAADLTRQMLTYAGKERSEKTAVDLNRLVRDTMRLLRATVPGTARVDLNLDPDLPPILGDLGQIQQVILNLITNAIEALPAAGGGRIAIRTAYRPAADRFQVGLFELEPGNYAQLEVEDSGVGMTREVLERIFDPFFTTKFTGRGLGLAAVQGIMRNHEGAIEAQSEPGRGASFRAWFPISDDGAGAASTDSHSFAAEGSGTVLIVDDEYAVRTTCQRVLLRHGYGVVLAENAERGIEEFRRHKADLVAMVVDLSMPGQSGLDVLAALEAEFDGIRVILSTGHASRDLGERIRRFPSVALLQKPYRAGALLKAVQADRTIC